MYEQKYTLQQEKWAGMPSKRTADADGARSTKGDMPSFATTISRRVAPNKCPTKERQKQRERAGKSLRQSTEMRGYTRQLGETAPRAAAAIARNQANRPVWVYAVLYTTSGAVGRNEADAILQPRSCSLAATIKRDGRGEGQSTPARSSLAYGADQLGTLPSRQPNTPSCLYAAPEWRLR